MVSMRVWLEIMFTVACSGIILGFLTEQYIRSRRDWHGILARLRFDWNPRDVSTHFLWDTGVSVNETEIWQALEGPRGLWIMRHNAGVVLELVEYADRRLEHGDPEMIQELREAAMRIRMEVTRTLVLYLFKAMTVEVTASAMGITRLYIEFTAGVARFLEVNAAEIYPVYVASM